MGGKVWIKTHHIDLSGVQFKSHIVWRIYSSYGCAGQDVIVTPAPMWRIQSAFESFGVQFCHKNAPYIEEEEDDDDEEDTKMTTMMMEREKKNKETKAEELKRKRK